MGKFSGFSSILADPHGMQDKDNECLLEHEESYRTSSRRSCFPRLWLVLHIALLASATITFLIGSARLNEAYSIPLERNPLDIIARQDHKKLEGDFDHQTVFKGRPRPDLDEAWDKISNGQVISIKEDVFLLLNKTPEGAAQLPAAQGGGYIASLEIFHQLHCLNMIRKFTYLDYYRDELQRHNPSMKVLIEHKDHCIDILRQVIMCSGDTGLITYTVEKGRSVPKPNFSNTKICKNFSDIVAWVNSSRVPDSRSYGGTM